MSKRTLWKGYLQFDDLSVAVKLSSTVREERVHFHLLHRSDEVRLHQQMICAFEKKPVPVEEQVRGYEVEEGKYILIDPDEFAVLEPEASRVIEVHEFVPSEQIDPLYLEHVYALEPDDVAGGFGELREVLQELGVAGICTWTMRKRSYFGALQAHGNHLRLCTLRYADEVISVDSLELQVILITEKEVRIGRDLIGQLTAPFQPEKFESEHQGKLMALIEKKARGEKVALLRPKLLKPTPPDKLLEALEASLKKVG